MKNLCKHFSGGGKIGNPNSTSVILSKAKNLGNTVQQNSSFKKILHSSFFILNLLALTACNNEESFDAPSTNKLSITVGIDAPASRSLITATTLPDGDTGAIGIMLTDGDETITDYDAYTNVKFTGTTTGGTQSWTGATDVLLTDNPGTLYAYYPYATGTDLSAIAIETGTQTDYLYATPVTGIKETSSSAKVVMNHVLTNINLTFVDGSYAGTGNITSVSVSGDGIATGGTFNAAQATPGFVADSYTGVGTAITSTTTSTLGGAAYDIMVVSNDASAPITVTAVIDDVEYEVTTTAVELTKGNSYQYTLTLNSSYMTVSQVSVTAWNPVTKEDLTMEKYNPWNNVDNGVYAVAADGTLVDVADADESCIAVALIVTDAPTAQRLMIEKYETANAAWGGITAFYWGVQGTDISGITNYSYVDDTNSTGGFPELSSDYTTWTAGALSDFNGEDNSDAMVAESTSTSYISGILNTFNNATDSQNQGYSDWYIPACGQLALMYLNMTAINETLTAIGGTTIASDYYWSSSEDSFDSGWCVNFYDGRMNGDEKDSSSRVRFVRDIE